MGYETFLIDRQAYITILIGRDYLDGVKVLKRSLDKTKPKHPFYVLLPDNISKDIADELENEKINILYTSPLGNEVMGRDNKKVGIILQKQQRKVCYD